MPMRIWGHNCGTYTYEDGSWSYIDGSYKFACEMWGLGPEEYAVED